MKGKGSNKHDMLSGDVSKTLWKLTGPMILALIAMVAFNLVDTMYVGWLGSTELAAMSFTFPVVFIFASITLGLGTGATSIIARVLGAGDKERATRLTVDSLILSLLITGIFMVIGFLTIEPVFSAMGVEEDVMPLVKSYMEIWYLGMIFVVIPMVGNSIIRATGDTTTPMYIMLVAVVTNIVLDPLLIFGYGPFPRMELEGAAWATVFSRMITMVMSLYVLGYMRRMLKWGSPKLKDVLQSWKDVFYVGGPTALVNVLVPLSMAVITAMVASCGILCVAGYGAATKVEALVMMPVIGFCTALVPFVGQNFGAGKIDRVEEAIKIGYKWLFLWGVIAFVALAATAPFTALIFTDDPEVVRSYTQYLLYGGIGFSLIGWAFMASNFFNALGRPFPSAVLMLLRVFLLMVPLAYIGGEYLGLIGIFIGVALANIIGGILSKVWTDREVRKERKPVNEESG